MRMSEDMRPDSDETTEATLDQEVNMDPGPDEEVIPTDDAVIQQLQIEKAELHDQLLRLQAEFINYRRLQETRIAQDRKFATERLVRELLPVLDNFERTVRHLSAGTPVEQMIDGIQAVEKQFMTVLQGQGVTRIASIGESFNPEIHEAIGIVESNEHEEGTVLEEVEAGFRIAERIIRPARVKVSKPV